MVRVRASWIRIIQWESEIWPLKSGNIWNRSFWRLDFNWSSFKGLGFISSSGPNHIKTGPFEIRKFLLYVCRVRCTCFDVTHFNLLHNTKLKHFNLHLKQIECIFFLSSSKQELCKGNSIRGLAELFWPRLNTEELQLTGFDIFAYVFLTPPKVNKLWCCGSARHSLAGFDMALRGEQSCINVAFDCWKSPGAEIHLAPLSNYQIFRVLRLLRREIYILYEHQFHDMITGCLVKRFLIKQYDPC